MAVREERDEVVEAGRVEQVAGERLDDVVDLLQRDVRELALKVARQVLEFLRVATEIVATGPMQPAPAGRRIGDGVDARSAFSPTGGLPPRP